MDDQQLAAYSSVQLFEKQIEPDRNLTIRLNRNFQLGNIPKQEMKFYFHKVERTIDLLNYPPERNGWMYERFAVREIEKLDTVFVMSGSSDGFTRTINNTRTNVQRLKDESPKKSMFAGLFKREEN